MTKNNAEEKVLGEYVADTVDCPLCHKGTFDVIHRIVLLPDGSKELRFVCCECRTCGEQSMETFSMPAVF